jgi:MFS family permease
MARSARVHYAWVVAAVSFLTLLTAAGLRAAPGVLIVPLEREFGWSRARISFAIGVNVLLCGLIGPFAAALMDRFGLRRTMLAALALIAVGVALTALVSAVFCAGSSAPISKPSCWPASFASRLRCWYC